MSKNLGGILVLVAAAAVGGFFGIRYLVRQSALSEFTALLAEYSRQPQDEKADLGEFDPPKIDVPRAAYISKRLIAVDLTDKKIDWIYFDLPEDLRAQTPADVGTVVHLNYTSEQVGRYGATGGGAYRRVCDVTVIDNAQQKVVGRAQFKGGEPPASSNRGAAAYGTYPTSYIVDYLKQLPRK